MNYNRDKYYIMSSTDTIDSILRSPISGEVYNKPIVASNGKTYEKKEFDYKKMGLNKITYRNYLLENIIDNYNRTGTNLFP